MKQISILTFILASVLAGCDNKKNIPESAEEVTVVDNSVASYIHPELGRSLDRLIAYEAEKANPFHSGFDFINCIFSGDTLEMYGAPYCHDEEYRTVFSYKGKIVFIYSRPQFDWRYYCDIDQNEETNLRENYAKKQYLNDVPNVDLDLELLKFDISKKDSFELVWHGLY